MRPRETARRAGVGRAALLAVPAQPRAAQWAVFGGDHFGGHTACNGIPNVI